MTTALMDAALRAGKAGLEHYLQQHDTIAPTLRKNDTVYRYKGTSQKELLTLFDTISIHRAMFYDEHNGGQYYFPLDDALELQKDDFDTLETRDMILFASASCVPAELERLLKKCSLCTPSRTAIQNIINRDGEAMESLRAPLSQQVFEQCPIAEQTTVIVGSMDGVNVLLRDKGKKTKK